MNNMKKTSPPIIGPASIHETIELPVWQRSLINLWFIVSFVIVIFSVFGHMQIAMSNDHLDLTSQAKKLFAGAKPYVDWVDVNPPMIHFIYSIPIFISHATGVFLKDVLNAYVTLLVFVSLLLSYVALLHSTASAYTRNLVVSSLALALFTVSFIHQAFGDREHLMIVLTAPWFVLFSPLVRREMVPVKWRVFIAAFAAFGFAIKPYCYIFYIATIAYWMMRGTTLKDLIKQFEHYIVIGLALIYLIAMLTYFSAWLTEIVPLASKTYWAINWLFSSKVDIIEQEFLTRYASISLVGILIVWLTAPSLYVPAINYLLFLLLACIGYYLMNGGWHYTQYPFMTYAWMLLVLVAALHFKICGKVKKKIHQRFSILLVALIFGGTMSYSYMLPALERASWDMRTTREKGHPLGTRSIEGGAAARIYYYIEQHPKFMFLATNLWGVNLESEGSPAAHVGRFDFLWFLPGIVEIAKKPHRRHEVQQLMDYLGNSLAEDLQRFKPGIIISDISPQQRSLPTSYSVIAALREHKLFMEQLANYELTETPNACNQYATQNCAYEIYVRKGAN
jgi:hypothetical protein